MTLQNRPRSNRYFAKNLIARCAGDVIMREFLIGICDDPPLTAPHKIKINLTWISSLCAREF